VRTFASVVGVERGRSPRFLDEPGTAFVALVAARVVLTAADEAQRVARVGEITAVCVTITHATTSDRHVLDAVVVLNTHTRLQLTTVTKVLITRTSLLLHVTTLRLGIH